MDAADSGRKFGGVPAVNQHRTAQLVRHAVNRVMISWSSGGASAERFGFS